LQPQSLTLEVFSILTLGATVKREPRFTVLYRGLL
jgi:hypothetical protein